MHQRRSDRQEIGVHYVGMLADDIKVKSEKPVAQGGGCLSVSLKFQQMLIVTSLCCKKCKDMMPHLMRPLVSNAKQQCLGLEQPCLQGIKLG